MVELPSSADTPLLAGKLYQMQLEAPEWVLRQIWSHPNWRDTLVRYIEEHPDSYGTIEIVGAGVQNNAGGERVFAIAFRPIEAGSSGGRSSTGIASASLAVGAIVATLGILVAGLYAVALLKDRWNEGYRLYLLEEGVDVPVRDETAIGRAAPVLAWGVALLGVGYVLRALGAFR